MVTCLRCPLSPPLQVNIQVPSPELQCDIISITGLANHLDRAREGLLERVKELQLEQEDRVSAGAPCWPGGGTTGDLNYASPRL